MVVLQQATEPLARHHAPFAFRLGRYGQNQLIVQALMVPLVMIMRHELAHRPPERPLTNENQAVQTRFFDASYEALRVRVEIRGTGWQSDRFNTRAGQCLAERDREERIPIVDQEAFARQEAIVGIGDVATHLAHPRSVGLRRDAGDLDSARRQVDDEEHGKPRQAATGPDVDGEEVCGGEDGPVRLQEFCPGRLLHTFRRGVQAVCAEDVGDRPSADLVAQIRERALNPHIAPVAILRRHADN